MIRLFLLWAVLAILPVFSQLASADAVDDCRTDCEKELSACIVQANQFVNDIEIQNAKSVCNTIHSDCNEACMKKEQNREFDKTRAPEPEQ
jgi:hypothetical protein